MKKYFTLGSVLCCLLLSAAFAQQPKEILLWPNGAPGSEGKSGDEAVRVTQDGEHVVSSIHKPSLTPYLPAKDKATGAAVIVAPGGGHRELWMDHEGHNFAKWLAARGIAAFVLKYRLAREPNSTYKIEEHGWADTQRAIRLVRSRAKEFGINLGHVGVAGFSAGGEVAAFAAMRYDAGNKNSTDPIEREPSRPDFQAMIYPGQSGKIVPTKDSPPIFLLAGYKDRPDISRGLAEVYLRFKDLGVPAELHLYATAGHGFGMRERNQSAVATWPARFEEWLSELGMFINEAPKIAGNNAPAKVTIAANDEPGERLIVSGVAFGADGKTPLANASVYVYHTDAKGLYTPGAYNDNRIPRLRGYLRTDAQGRYEYSTIKPGHYPDDTAPMHIHYHVNAQGHRENVFEIVFDGDPKLGADIRAKTAQEGSRFTLCKPTPNAQGVAHCTQNVTLKQ